MPNINDLLSPQQNPNQMMPPGGAPGPMPGAGAPAMLPPDQAGAMPAGMPPGMPGDPAMADQGSAPISPDQRAELDRLYSGVKTANNKTVSDQLVSRNEITLMRKELISKMFDLLKQAGVDPGNPESVRSFLENLSNSDPDLYQMFETAFQGLMGGDVSSPDDTGAPETPPDADPNAVPPMMPGAPGQDPGQDLTSRFQNLQQMQ